jgi:hypothetical protein
VTTILVVVSDLHSNSTLGLCPTSVVLDEGGTYEPGLHQKWLWFHWVKFWERVKAARKRGYRLIVVLNGDIMDGDHHGTAQLISRNMATQHRIVVENLQPIFDLKPTKIFVVRGTEAHTGKSGQYEEMIASDIQAEQDEETGSYSWWWLPIEVEGVQFDIAHHGRAGYRPWTRANATQMLAAELTMRYAQEGSDLPDVAIRSHTHQPADSYDNYPLRLLQTPAWQASTAFGQRLQPGSLLPCGGYIFKCRDGEYELEKLIFRPKRRKSLKV